MIGVRPDQHAKSKGSSPEPAFPPGAQILSYTYMSTTSDLAAIENKLDLLISLLRIAHDEPLKAEREAILSEPVSKAILAASADWIEAGKLKAAVIKKTKVSTPTVSRRLAELVERGLITRRGSGGKVSYRTTGLIDP
jgi:DNA-binding transcriptional ArsR family regulator